MLTPEQEVEVAAKELLRVAYHETAHKVICERFGGSGDVHIWRNDKPGECAWRGQFCVDVFPWMAHEVRKAAGIRQVREPVYSREYIAMAGMIAELLLEDIRNQTDYVTEADVAPVIAERLVSMIEDCTASESDLRGMGVSYCEDSGDIVGWNNRLVLTGIRMVREEWTKIVTEAERLIADATSETAQAA